MDPKTKLNLRRCLMGQINKIDNCNLCTFNIVLCCIVFYMYHPDKQEGDKEALHKTPIAYLYIKRLKNIVVCFNANRHCRFKLKLNLFKLAKCVTNFSATNTAKFAHLYKLDFLDARKKQT